MSTRVRLVKVRLSGDAEAFDAVLAALTAGAQDGAFTLAEMSGLYPSRRDPGCRVYLTLVVPDAAAEATEGQCGAAHHRQATRRPAAPIPAKESRGRNHLP